MAIAGRKRGADAVGHGGLNMGRVSKIRRAGKSMARVGWHCLVIVREWYLVNLSLLMECIINVYISMSD
ncbi:hypothetical protein AU511_07765 [Lonsdalea iberica]|uniref:Uncharacterized protein n=1 Tax=Lonsdalea iberica TaxID=1082703 RepID=A0A1X3RW52_9GAMM|nr:hypothetical protein AU511_07765 [Lonsdalea iberica]